MYVVKAETHMESPSGLGSNLFVAYKYCVGNAAFTGERRSSAAARVELSAPAGMTDTVATVVGRTPELNGGRVCCVSVLESSWIV